MRYSLKQMRISFKETAETRVSGARMLVSEYWKADCARFRVLKRVSMY